MLPHDHGWLHGSLGVLAGLALVVPGTADAAPCGDLPNPVYLQVGDTQEPLMKQLGRLLRENTSYPVTLIYKTSGSCTNIEAMYQGTDLVTNPKFVPSVAEDPSWTPAMPAPTCDIDPAGVELDVANSNVFLDACTTTPMPVDVRAYTGPVQPYLFIVPEASTQTAILAEEAYFTFGLGNAAMVDPWDDESLLFIRTTTKSTLIGIAANIGVPPIKMKGVPFDASSEVLNAVATSVDPERTIGIMGSEIYDQNRDVVNSLAFRAYQQKFAYYPDSTPDSFDKKNVRDGHYTIWSPTIYLTRVDAQSEPVNPRAAYVIDLILGRAVSPAPNFESLDVVVDGVKLVPSCAMEVQREIEGGPLSLYMDEEPCGCFFESKVGTLLDSCTPCLDDDNCTAGGVCRHGYCEGR